MVERKVNIDIAIISNDIKDKFDDMAKLMRLTWDLDLRIEPHPINTKEFNKNETPFIDEIIKTGITVYAA